MFNTGIGQHILKNPLIVNSIIDKVGVNDEKHSISVSLIFFLRIYACMTCRVPIIIPAFGEAEAG